VEYTIQVVFQVLAALTTFDGRWQKKFQGNQDQAISLERPTEQ